MRHHGLLTIDNASFLKLNNLDELELSSTFAVLYIIQNALEWFHCMFGHIIGRLRVMLLSESNITHHFVA